MNQPIRPAQRPALPGRPQGQRPAGIPPQGMPPQGMPMQSGQPGMQPNGGQPAPKKNSSQAWTISIIITVICVAGAGYLFMDGASKKGEKERLEAIPMAVTDLLNGNFNSENITTAQLEHLKLDSLQQAFSRYNIATMQKPTKDIMPPPRGTVEDYLNRIDYNKNLYTQHTLMGELKERAERAHSLDSIAAKGTEEDFFELATFFRESAIELALVKDLNETANANNAKLKKLIGDLVGEWEKSINEASGSKTNRRLGEAVQKLRGPDSPLKTSHAELWKRYNFASSVQAMWGFFSLNDNFTRSPQDLDTYLAGNRPRGGSEWDPDVLFIKGQLEKRYSDWYADIAKRFNESNAAFADNLVEVARTQYEEDKTKHEESKKSITEKVAKFVKDMDDYKREVLRIKADVGSNDGALRVCDGRINAINKYIQEARALE